MAWNQWEKELLDLEVIAAGTTYADAVLLIMPSLAALWLCSTKG